MRCILHTSTQSYSLVPNRPNSFDDFYVQFKLDEQEGEQEGEQLYSIFIHPKTSIQLKSIELVLPVQLDESSRFLANGFQSWSETYTVRPDEPPYALRWPAKTYLQYYDDTWLKHLFSNRNLPYSWAFAGLNHKQKGYQFLASLDDRSGFSLIEMDEGQSAFHLKKDLSGITLKHSFEALKALFCTKNTEKAAFEAFATHAAWPAPTSNIKGLAWTSWYHFYEKINAENVMSALHEVQASDLPFSLFQIDDGWQAAIGDWLQCNDKFPKGLAAIAQQAKAANLVPGLWLAPFCVSANSQVYQKYPDWILKDKKGKPIRVGKNKAWGGWYYALDFYNQGVRDYLSGVFHTIFQRWGFGMVKLDFLFAACLQAPAGKTTGQVMHEVMEWLRLLCKNQILLACGVPLGSALGQVDMCRIGGDIGRSWTNWPLRLAGHRGRISTKASLRSTLHRWALNQKAFLNDPDVFILREENQSMSLEQRKTLLQVNAALGGVLFTSDLPKTHWTAEHIDLIQEALSYQGSTIHVVQSRTDDNFLIRGTKPDGSDFELDISL